MLFLDLLPRTQPFRDEQVKAVYASTVPVPCEERGKWNHMFSKGRKASQKRNAGKNISMGQRHPAARSQRGWMPSNVPPPPDSRGSGVPGWQMLPKPSHRLHLVPSVPLDAETAAGGTKKIRLAGCERSQLFCLMPSICDGGDRY